MIEVGKTYYIFNKYVDIIKILRFDEKFGVYYYNMIDSLHDINEISTYTVIDIDDLRNETLTFHTNSIYYQHLRETTYTSVLDLIKENPELFL